MNTFWRPVIDAQRPPLVLRVGLALAALGVALGLSLLFRLFFGTGTFLLFFGTVAIIAAYSGLRIGLVSVVISLVLLNYFSFPPFDTLAITPDVLARAGIFVFVTSLIGWLGEARRASEREREALLSRERALRQRTALLAELGIAMTSSLDYMTIFQQLARTVVPFLADYCIVYIQQPNGMIERMVVVHRDPEVEALLHEIQTRDSIDPQGPNPVAKVLRTGTPDVAFTRSPDDAQTRASSEEQRRVIELLRPQAYIIMPLIARGHTLGAISFTMTELGRLYTEDDVALAEEIARRAALAIDNAQLYQQAQEALRLREQFLSIAAHELKTPLTSLTGQVQLMQRRAERDGEVSERSQRSLAIINEQLRRLNKMVIALLDISRIEHGQLSIERRPLDMCQLVRQAVSEVQVTAEDRPIEAVCPDVPLIMVGDAIRLEQVLLNLIQNALQYSQPPAPTTVTVTQEGEQVSIAVQDRGIGIPAAAVPHLFTRFYRGESAETRHTGGMGIGLSVVKEIVTLHNGDVQVESSEGVGSTFTVRLPLKVDVEAIDAYN
jgi:K+-sensing histidine kinase KdpD